MFHASTALPLRKSPPPPQYSTNRRLVLSRGRFGEEMHVLHPVVNLTPDGPACILITIFTMLSRILYVEEKKVKHLSFTYNPAVGPFVSILKGQYEISLSPSILAVDFLKVPNRRLDRFYRHSTKLQYRPKRRYFLLPHNERIFSVITAIWHKLYQLQE
jgi:hypothetical protein